MRKGSPEIEIEIEVDAGSSCLAWLTQAATTPTRDKDWPGTGRGVPAGTRRSGTCWVIRSAETTGLFAVRGLA